MQRMMTKKFPENVVRAWNYNEVRLLVLLSLFLQTVLIIAGNRRKYISHTFLKIVIWIAYQSADWVATVALGVLSRSQGHKKDEALDPRFTIMAFWAPFLLLHLGGPDTITAYAMADNELWLRHALGLIVQTGVAIYVFATSWAGDAVNILALLMFVPGLVKYGERTWVLYSASRGRFRKSMVSDPDPGPNYAKFMDEYVARRAEGYRVSLGRAVDVSQVVHSPPTVDDQIIPEAKILNDASYFFKTFKKLFADLILSFQDQRDSQSFFKEISWERAFRIIEVELSLIFDIFYSKVPLIYSILGFFLRIVSLSFTLGILIAFLIINKHKYSTSIVEVYITYILSVGAVALEVYAILIAASSDRMMVLLIDSRRIPFRSYVKIAFQQVLYAVLRRVYGATLYLPTTSEMTQSQESQAPWFPRSIYKMGSILRSIHIVPSKKRWSNTMGQYNFFSVCLKEKPANCYKIQKLFGVHELLEKHRYGDKVCVPDGLKASIFSQLIERLTSSMDQDIKFNRYRGDQEELKKFEVFDDREEVEFDQSLLIWHIATELCYYTDFPEKSQLNKQSNHQLREWIYGYTLDRSSCSEQYLEFISETSKWLSEYMLYLLVCCPFMLPSGIGQTRYQDTLAEASEFIREYKSINRKEVTRKLLNVSTDFRPSEVKGDRSKTVLFDACRLAKSLRSLETNQESDRAKKWKTIIRVWVDLLAYAAAQCRWNDHAEQLREGGQLLTHVWLLMAHFGMTDQFQISQGYVRAKWQVN